MASLTACSVAMTISNFRTAQSNRWTRWENCGPCSSLWATLRSEMWVPVKAKSARHFGSVRELTRIAEKEIHEVVIVCTKERQSGLVAGKRRRMH